MDITHDNVCSSMLSCFYSHLLSTGRPISSCNYIGHIWLLLFNVSAVPKIVISGTGVTSTNNSGRLLAEKKST